MAYKLPYTYGEDQENQTPDGPGQTGEVQQVQPYDNVQPQQQQQQQQPDKPQLQSDTGQGSTGQPTAPVKTFAQLQQEGFARPPAPPNVYLAPQNQSQLQMAPPKNPSELTQDEINKLSVADRNKMSEAWNRYQAGNDAQGNLNSIKKAGGVYGDGEEAKARAEFMRQAGFGADGSYTPETEARPMVNPNIKNTINGFPSNYDPNRPKTPQPQPTAPPKYLINGKFYDNPQGQGQPIGPGPSSQPQGQGQPQGQPIQTPGQTGFGGVQTVTQGGGTNTSQTAPNNTFDLLQALTQGAQGQGQGSDVQKATTEAFLKYLQNPNPYGAKDVQDQYGVLGGKIDDQYSLQQQKLGEEMARRGLGYSTNYGGRLQDLNIGKRDAKTNLASDLLHQYAQGYGQNQQAALGLGNTIGTTAQNNQQNWLAQLMGYGQQAFNNDVTTNQMNQNAANNYQNWILQLLGLGYGGNA